MIQQETFLTVADTVVQNEFNVFVFLARIDAMPMLGM